ncbi:hypothetical protein Trydic_g2783 [Trypoxylus dichotomus]
MMNILESEDILQLPIFRCKLCHNRLQRPIMQVVGVGNTCGLCCNENCKKDAVRNEELEALLAKLHLPCNYAGNGCQVHGLFNDICDHEFLCFFRARNCPLERQGGCGNNFSSVDELINHIKLDHNRNVVDLSAPSPIPVKNPNKSRFNLFYLLVAKGMHFALRARFDAEGQQIMYQFYSLEWSADANNVRLSIALQSGDSIFYCSNLSNIPIKRLRRGEFPYSLNEKDASKITLGILQSFGCLREIRIGVKIKGNNAQLQPVATTDNVTLSFQCSSCSKIFSQITLCTGVRIPNNMHTSSYMHSSSSYHMQTTYTSNNYQVIQKCTTCANSTCSTCTAPSKHILIPSTMLVSKSVLPCKNSGCGKQIKPSEYELHYQSLCKFREYTCNVISVGKACSWKGIVSVVTDHLRDTHASVVNLQTMVIYTGQTYNNFFVKEYDLFRQQYILGDGGQLTITTEELWEPQSCHEYIWQLYFQHPTTGCRTVISSNYTHRRCAKTIDVKDCVTENCFKFQITFDYAPTNV